MRAARAVFHREGPEAPLFAVAREAGLGQGTLYRHFPDKASLALAIFEENVAELEALAVREASTLDDCLDLLIRQDVDEAAVCAILVRNSGEERIAELTARVEEIVAEKLAAAQEEGLYADDVDAHDCYLATILVACYLPALPRGESTADVAKRAWAILRRGLTRR